MATYANFAEQLEAMRNGVPSAEVFAGGVGGTAGMPDVSKMTGNLGSNLDSIYSGWGIDPNANPFMGQLEKAFPNGSPFQTFAQENSQAAPGAPINNPAARIQPLGSWRTNMAMRQQNGMQRDAMRMPRDAFHDQRKGNRDMAKFLKDMPAGFAQMLGGLFGNSGGMNGRPYQAPYSRSFMGPGNTPASFRQMPALPGQTMPARAPMTMPRPGDPAAQFQPALMGNPAYAARSQYTPTLPTTAAPGTPAPITQQQIETLIKNATQGGYQDGFSGVWV